MTLLIVVFLVLVPAFLLQVLGLKAMVAVFKKHGLAWFAALLVTLLMTLLAVSSMFLFQLKPDTTLVRVIQTILVLATLIGTFVLPVLILKKHLQIRTVASVGIVLATLVLNYIAGFGYAYIIRTYFVQAFQVSSGGMSPSLSDGDRVLVNKLLYRFMRQPDRGDIVVFRYPMDTSKDLIQRIMAVGGDTVEIRNKLVFVNGKQYENDPGVHTSPVIIPASEAPRDNLSAARVPADSFFVLGDNRENSFDSRFWGCVRIENIVGKPFVMYWSYDAKAKRVRSERIGKEVR